MTNTMIPKLTGNRDFGFRHFCVIRKLEFDILRQPMRIVIASSYVPFRTGGEVTLVRNLAAALSDRDYQVETVLLPFDSRWATVAVETLAIRSLDLTESSGNKIDLLITLQTPSYAI